MYLKHTLGSIQQRPHGPKADATSRLGSTLWHGRSAYLGLESKEREREIEIDFETVQSSNIKTADSSAVCGLEETRIKPGPVCVFRKDKSLLS